MKRPKVIVRYLFNQPKLIQLGIKHPCKVHVPGVLPSFRPKLSQRPRRYLGVVPKYGSGSGGQSLAQATAETKRYRRLPTCPAARSRDIYLSSQPTSAGSWGLRGRYLPPCHAQVTESQSHRVPDRGSRRIKVKRGRTLEGQGR